MLPSSLGQTDAIFWAAEIGAPTLPSFVPFDEAMRQPMSCWIPSHVRGPVPRNGCLSWARHNISDHAGRSDLWG